MRLKKSEVSDKLAEMVGVEKILMGKIIASLFILVKEELKKDNEITLGDLIILKPKVRKAREVRNPKTGEKKMAPDKKVVKIKQRKMLKKIFE